VGCGGIQSVLQRQIGGCWEKENRSGRVNIQVAGSDLKRCREEEGVLYPRRGEETKKWKALRSVIFFGCNPKVVESVLFVSLKASGNQKGKGTE